MKINDNSINKSYLFYLIGFFSILALPLLAFSPFYPPEWGKAIAFKIIFSCLLFLFAWQMLSDRKFFQQISSVLKSQKTIFWLLFAVLLTVLLSTLFSSDIAFSLWSSPHRSGGSVVFIFLILFSVILFLTLKNDDWKKLWNFSFLIGDLIVAFAMLQYFNVFPDFLVSYAERPPSTLSNSILFAAYLMLLIFPAFCFVIKKPGRHKIFYLISLILFIFGIMIGGSRAAYLGILVAGFYFLFFYPIIKTEKPEDKNFLKKLPILKIAALALILFAALGIYYVNTRPKLPQFLEKNQIFQSVIGRLSIDLALEEPRFSAWKVASQALKEKPILGWGPENFAIGFDKYYDPSLPYLTKEWGSWWDRAHNIFLDLAVQYGILFLLAYFSFFGYLFWKLRKIKRRTERESTRITIHGIQSLFLAYFTALFFGFDSVTTYIILFFIIGYSLHLTAESEETAGFNNKNNLDWWLFLNKKRGIIAGILLIFLVIFLWKYNLKPLAINAKINKIMNMACEKKLPAFENLFNQKSFLDSFLRLKYVDEVKNCDQIAIEEQINYIKKGVKALKDVSMIRPNYTRTWLMLGSLNAVLMTNETNPQIKENLAKESNFYFEKALSLGPKHQETLAEWAKSYFVQENYPKMKEKSESCIALNDDVRSCYWYLGLSEILLGNKEKGEEHLKTAKEKSFLFDTRAAWSQLAIAYTKTENYKELISVYNSLTAIDPNSVQYRASLSVVYAKLGDFQSAKREALKIIDMAPEEKERVEEFLKTLR